MKKSAAVVLALLLAGLLPAARAADLPALLPLQSQAPDFEAVDLQGNAFRLSEELKKGPVLLVFWSIF